MASAFGDMPSLASSTLTAVLDRSHSRTFSGKVTGSHPREREAGLGGKGPCQLALAEIKKKAS